MERAISHISEFLASVTKVALTRSPEALAGGRPAPVLGVVGAPSDGACELPPSFTGGPPEFE
jgi:hypothetical protein